MSRLEEIGRALKNADAAGDTEAARKLAQAYRQEQQRMSAPQDRAPAVNLVDPGTKGEWGFVPQPSRVYETLERGGVALGSMPIIPAGKVRVPGPGAQLGGRQGMNRGDIENFDPASLDTPLSPGIKDRMPMAQSVALGTVDMARNLGSVGDALLELNPATRTAAVGLQGYRAANQGVGPVEQGWKNIVDAPARALGAQSPDQDFEAAMTRSLEDNPVSTRAGQALGLTAGGGAQFTNTAMRTAPALISPKMAARMAGGTIAKRLGRYGGRLGMLGGIGAADYGAYNFLSEAPNIARQEGEGPATVDDRLGYAASEALSPYGWAPLPAMSMAYRLGRAGVTAGVNTARASAAAPKPEVAASGLGGNLEWRGGTFTPSDVKARTGVGDINWELARNSTLRQRVIDKVLDEGFDPDTAERTVRLLSYDNYSNVDEMLFELDATLKSLATAVGRSKSVGEDVLRDAFKARREGMNDEIRNALRSAVGASGDDLETFAGNMTRAAEGASSKGYAAAHSKTVSNQTWQNIVSLIGEVGEDGIDAARKGAQLARNAARRRPEYIAAARELDELADAIQSGSVPNAKTSTLALDFLDRGINRKIGVASRAGDKPYSASLMDFRNSLRGSGLDADTGLNVPRTIYAQYQAAARAMEFGEKLFGKSRSLRDMKQQFTQAMRQADEAFEEGIGEGSGIIDQSLMMGWVRGAENAIETADNPGTLIRQLYGSERQREKLLSMLQELPDEAPSGIKSDVTKRKKALVGSKGVSQDYKFDFALSTGERVKGRTQTRSLFDRQRDMLESERITVGGSPTAGASEALAEHGSRQRWQKALGLVESVVKAPHRIAARVIDNMTEPLIFQKEGSRELAELLSTRGRDRLLSVIDEIRQRQIARTGGAPPPAAPTPPAQGPRPGGGGASFARAREAGRVTPEERAVLFGDPDDVKAGGFAFRPRQTRAEPFNDPRLTPSENKAVEMRRNGFTVREIADEMDIADNNVTTIIASARGKGVDVGELARDRVRDDILALAEKGLPPRVIAERLGRSVNSVKSTLSQARRAAGNDRPDWLAPGRGGRPIVAGIQTDLGNAAGGAIGGGIAPIPSTGDPREDARNRLIAVLGGAGAGFGARRMAGRGGNAFASDVSAQGLKGGGLRYGKDPTKTQNIFRDVTGKPFNADPDATRKLSRMQNNGNYIDVKLPTNRLNATQAEVHPGYAENTSNRYLEGAGGVEAPAVVKYKGQYYVTDGHHRITTAAMRDGSDIRVRLYDLDGDTDLTTPLLDFNAERHAKETARRKKETDEIYALLFGEADITPTRSMGFGAGGGRNLPRQPSTRGEVARDVGLPRLGRRAGDPSQAELPKAPVQVERRTAPNPLEMRGQPAIPPTPHTEAWYQAHGFPERVRNRLASIIRSASRPVDRMMTTRVFTEPVLAAREAARNIAASRPNITVGEALLAPGRSIAAGMRTIDRRLRSPEDPRLLQPAIAAGDMRAPASGNVPTNRAAIERMRNPAAAADELAAIRRRADDAQTLGRSVDSFVPGRAGRALNTMKQIDGYLRQLSQRVDEMRGQGLNPQEMREAMSARADTAAAYHDAWRRVLAARKTGDAQAIRRAEAEVEQVRGSFEAMKNPPGQPRQLAVLERIDNEIRRAMNDVDAGMRGTLSGGRQLRRDAEVADLMTNPARAQDALRVSQARPLGSWERTGQALAAASAGGAAAYGTKAYQDEREKSREDYFAKRDAWDHQNKHVDTYPEARLKELQSFLNYVVPGDGEIAEDGRWGPKTAERVRAYQKLRGLKVNGRLTWETIEDAEREMRGAPVE